MCGLAGFLGTPEAPAAARALLERMIGTLHHRGPDGFGFHVEGGVGLAHARLAVIDLTTGAQPIANERGTVWTVLNGEIFNYRALRTELVRRGHRFATQSDTEVIVHLYEEHGDRFVEHLNGDFALALWDGERGRLLLARDRFGVRPLFHASAAGRMWFASEIKAILAALPTRARLDPAGLAQAFTFWGPLDPGSVFVGVESLPPGHLLAIGADGQRALTRYWDWSFPAPGAPPRWCSVEQAAGELRELLTDAVRLRLQADVPLGAYLSGGLDSSAVVALMREAGASRLRSYSIAFDSAEFDESEHQQAMVRHLGCEHDTLRCTSRAIGEAFPHLIRQVEAPVLRTAGVPLMLLARRVREDGCKVVLTGEGADEVFAGYDLFKEAKVRRFWARQPGSRLRPALLGRLYGYLENSPVRHAALAQSFFGRGMEHLPRPVFAHVPRWASSQSALRFLAPELRAGLGGFEPLDWYERRLPPAIASWSPLARDQYVEAKTLLAGYLLPAQGDRPAMAHGVEGRFPFLDHRVVEFANALPDRWKIRGLTEKYLLRRALEGLLPPAIRQRTKQPYRAPDQSSFFVDGEPLDFVADLMSPARLHDAGYFDAAAVGRLFEKCRRGRAIGFADNQAFVGILSTMLVDEFFVRRAAA
ncbi:MAG TPA: asparagine synthase (glutamine-hydrolyzing) [Frateuria sp.]|uniref:asparagine synthase (glutamine-hydrolyzing) n=1 Tax=Frateuria sp. TaxID=2211372 RepID=UPI002DEE0B6A|nr:asparagine synthase (glutamine-hydrolyzing) [Frateuria sp.]